VFFVQLTAGDDFAIHFGDDFFHRPYHRGGGRLRARGDREHRQAWYYKLKKHIPKAPILAGPSPGKLPIGIEIL
jgi:hypothetical protein